MQDNETRFRDWNFEQCKIMKLGLETGTLNNAKL